MRRMLSLKEERMKNNTDKKKKIKYTYDKMTAVDWNGRKNFIVKTRFQ